jgi:hypothetical protein
VHACKIYLLALLAFLDWTVSARLDCLRQLAISKGFIADGCKRKGANGTAKGCLRFEVPASSEKGKREYEAAAAAGPADDDLFQGS